MNTFFVCKLLDYNVAEISLLCNFNKRPNLNHLNVCSDGFFDYSHKFILNIPICQTCKLSTISIADLISKNAHELSRLLNMINVEKPMRTMCGPETNQQPIIQMFEIPYMNDQEYEFLKNVQEKYNCLDDFDFLHNNQKYLLEYGLHIGKAFKFSAILTKPHEISTHYLKSGNYTCKSLRVYKLIVNNEPNTIKYYSLVNKLWFNPDIFQIENDIEEDFWSVCAFDIECGRIKTYTDRNDEPMSLASPLDSHVQVIAVALFHMNNVHVIHFVFLPPEFRNVKLVEDEFNKYIYFNCEYNMICAFYLFINRFNQIVGINSMNFDEPFLLNRVCVLKNKLTNINYHSIGYPLSIRSVISKKLVKTCLKCKDENLPFNTSCEKCSGSLTEMKVVTLKNVHCNASLPLSVSIDLKDLTWDANKRLNEHAGGQSLAMLTRYWFKKEIMTYFRFKHHVYLVVEYESLSAYNEKCKKFGSQNITIVWFEFDSETMNFLEFFLGEIDSEFHLLDHNKKCFLFYKIKSNHSAPEFNFKELMNIDLIKQLPKSNKHYVSFTKNEIDGFLQRCPQSNQDYVNLIKYSRNDAILTLFISMEINQDHLTHYKARQYNCGRYEAYTFQPGKISNFLCTEQYYNVIPYAGTCTRWNRFKYYILCTCDAVKNNDFKQTASKYGRFYEFDAAHEKSSMMYGVKNINEEKLGLSENQQSCSIKDVEKIWCKFLSDK
jgi:hypothetical protein